MSLDNLITIVSDKEHFSSLTDYIDFAGQYLDFVTQGLQAVIVSQNENHYQFYQYKEDGHFNITRPLNSHLMYTAEDRSKVAGDFLDVLEHIRDIPDADVERRRVIIRAI